MTIERLGQAGHDRLRRAAPVAITVLVRNERRFRASGVAFENPWLA